LIFSTKKQKSLVFSDEVYRITVFICHFRRKFPTNNAMPRMLNVIFMTSRSMLMSMSREHTWFKRSSLFCDSSTFRFVHISPSAPMIISGTITLVTVFQFIEIL
ncbi:hypothetical protein T02_14677, partial [Trichinella nativa]